MKRITLVILISVIATLSIAASGCTYTTGGQNGTQNATQNASHVNIRLPLSNLFGYTAKSLTAISNRLTARSLWSLSPCLQSERTLTF